MDLASGPKNGADHDDVDLNQKLEAWEKFYNLNRAPMVPLLEKHLMKC